MLSTNKIAGCVCLLLIAACGTDDGSKSTGDSGSTLTSDTYRAAFVKATCEQAASCCTADEFKTLGFWDSSKLDDCITTMTTATQWMWLPDAATQARVSFDAVSAEKCIADIKAGCSATQQLLITEESVDSVNCRNAIVGQVKDGGVCFGQWECTNGYACHGHLPDSHLKGTCKKLPAKGQPCLVFNANGGGMSHCPAETTCIGGKCVDPPKEGESCGSVLACVGVLFCDPDTDKCVKPTKKTGEKCSSLYHRECISGTCEGGTSTNSWAGSCAEKMGCGGN